jgi:hypothetical protein
MEVQHQTPGAEGSQTPPPVSATPPAAIVPPVTDPEPPPAASSHGAEDEFNDSGWDEKTKAYIQKLRAESAKYRTKGNGLEERLNEQGKQFNDFQSGLKKALGIEEELSPEEQLTATQDSFEQVQAENAILKAGISYGISGPEDLDYFNYLIQREADGLEDGEELSEERLEEIVGQVQARSVIQPGAGNTSPVAPGAAAGKNSPAPGGTPSVSAEQFSTMTVTEKSDLFTKNRELYDKLMLEVKQKRLL